MGKVRRGCILSAGIILVMLLSVVSPIALAKTNIPKGFKGYDKGVSWESVVPLKKVAFVNFDKDSYLDDYAYLSAVPTAVFYDRDTERLFSYPLLYYTDPYPIKDKKERTLDARKGIDYFMEDWLSYCNGRLDQIVLINVDKEKVKQWPARDVVEINGDDPYEIASKIALHDWSYSDSAVVAVIDNNPKEIDIIKEGKLSEVFQPASIDHMSFSIELPSIGAGPTYRTFDIKDKSYKYIVAKLSWPVKLDYDLQLYDLSIGMLDCTIHDYRDHAEWLGYKEMIASFIHHHGKWQVSVTAVAKKGFSFDFTDNSTKEGFIPLSFKDLAKAIKNEGSIDIYLYPGFTFEIPATPFGCRDINFTLRWNDPNIRLGFTIIDPAGTEICSSIPIEEIIEGKVEKKGEESIHLDQLGECKKGENYTICVFSLDNVTHPLDIEFDYRWHQKIAREEGDSFVSASNGAILASMLNVPLLYTAPDSLPSQTKKALDMLGVERIYIINIGGHLKSDVKSKLGREIIKEYKVAEELYRDIKKMSNEDTIVFTTIDPWSYWYAEELKPAGEFKGALFVGPASYIAAHHGVPVLIVDEYPELSQAVVYHTEFWKRYSSDRYEHHPSSGSMYMSGKEVYRFLERCGLGKLEEGNEQIRETIITVADEYDIGIPWDRSFTGAAYPGRFWGSPVDCSYAICRDVFYPSLIFVNPATDPNGIELINGSKSISKPIGGRLKKPYGSTLVIIKPSQEERFVYPILSSLGTYMYRFNEIAWKHWNFRYTRADGVVPYFTPSPDRIDQDICHGKKGAYYPDLSESEVIPIYAKRAGYSPVFSTNFSAVVTNLNRGVILWIVNNHGDFRRGGKIAMWDPRSPYVREPNPWREYEVVIFRHFWLYPRWLMFYLGSIPGNERLMNFSEPFIKFNPFPEKGCTENPDAAVSNFQRTFISRVIASIPSLSYVFEVWGINGFMIHRDRLLHPFKARSEGLPVITFHDGKVLLSGISGTPTVDYWMNTGFRFDDHLKNLHSCGIPSTSCLPAGTLLHLTWMRHGSSFQIMDPWTTTDWCAVWIQMFVKRIALGDTIGEAYERGMRATGPEVLAHHWWWDKFENVELFGDPDLRVWVPSKEYSSANHWEREDVKPLKWDGEEDWYVDGHMIFGASEHPHAKKPTEIPIIIAIAVISVLVIVIGAVYSAIKRKKK